MHIFREIGPLRAHLREQHLSHRTIGFVPTMGALHKGHLNLIRASKAENDITVCSIFVNPAQFNNPDDLNKYPRTQDQDFELLRNESCDVVFFPSSGEMYPETEALKFDFGTLDKILEGEFRPGHFSGVALVVSKLFNIVKPDTAYFGQKDFQQFKIISRLVRELKFEIKLVCVPIVREEDGLAMSSRNMRLNEKERSRAAVIHRCLTHTRDGLLQGKTFNRLKDEAEVYCKENNVKLEYLALADCENLNLLEKPPGSGDSILLMAAYVGEVRLIDNLFVIKS